MSEQAKFAYDDSNERDPLVRIRRRTSGLFKCGKYTLGLILLLILVAVVLVLVLAIGIGVGVSNANQSATLYNSVKIENLVVHLQKLEDIAQLNNNSRAVMYGYNESADMVFQRLSEAGYEVTKQEFPVATYEDNGNHVLSAVVPLNDTENLTFDFVLSSQFNVMRYSGSTNDALIIGTISVASGFGCSVDDYTSDTVALIDYVIDENEAGCSLFGMAQAAKSAGVTALLFVRRENDSNKNIPPNARIFNQTTEGFQVVDLPLLGVNYQVGQILRREGGPITVSLRVNMVVEFWITSNILAYTKEGKESATIVMGSHLDSVAEGPGINDNGSGSMANLEIALQLVGRGTSPINKVMFAFWGAEEWGLLGSNYFVMSLPVEERENIALNLNFDMIGSPNYIRKVYNGAEAENELIVNASATIQNLFEERFKSLDLPYQLTDFNGRSDYGPFIEPGVDIPAGGLFTGAEEKKTDVERETYGGFAGAEQDPCYHQYCDTVANVDQEVYEQMSQAAAYVLETLMMKDDLRSFLQPDDDSVYDY